MCCVKKALFIIMFSLYYIDNEDLLSSSGNVSGDDDDKDIDDQGLCGDIDHYSATFLWQITITLNCHVRIAIV